MFTEIATSQNIDIEDEDEDEDGGKQTINANSTKKPVPSEARSLDQGIMWNIKVQWF